MVDELFGSGSPQIDDRLDAAGVKRYLAVLLAGKPYAWQCLGGGPTGSTGPQSLTTVLRAPNVAGLGGTTKAVGPTSATEPKAVGPTSATEPRGMVAATVPAGA